MARDLYRAAIIRVIQEHFDDEQLREIVRSRLTIDFETILYDQRAEVMVKHYSESMMMVTVHIPKVKWSIYFIPLNLFYPVDDPRSQTFAQRFGQMRL